jgi:hypothetical protein
MAKRAGEALTVASEQVQSAVATVETLGEKIVAGMEKAKGEVKANMDKMTKTTEELVAFNQGNLEACMKAGEILNAGLQDLSKTMMANAQAQFEEGVAAIKAVAAAKSLTPLTDYARTSLDKAVADNAKLTEAGKKLAADYWAPLTAQAKLAVEKFGHFS